MTEEGQIKKSILEYLEWSEKTTGTVWAWPNPTRGVWDPVRKIFRKSEGLIGSSDILGIFMSKLLAIEVKTPKEKKFFLECDIKLSGDPKKDKKKMRILRQRWFLEKVKKRGGIAILADCVQDVENGLKLARNKEGENVQGKKDN